MKKYMYTCIRIKRFYSPLQQCNEKSFCILVHHPGKPVHQTCSVLQHLICKQYLSCHLICYFSYTTPIHKQIYNLKRVVSTGENSMSTLIINFISKCKHVIPCVKDTIGCTITFCTFCPPLQAIVKNRKDHVVETSKNGGQTSVPVCPKEEIGGDTLNIIWVFFKKY